MKEMLLVFLSRLEEAAPPPEHCHHALMRARYGSDKAGWTEKLALQMNTGAGGFITFFLEEDDFLDPTGTIQKLSEAFHKAATTSTQVQSAMANFGPGSRLNPKPEVGEQ